MHILDMASPNIMPRNIEAGVLGPRAKVDKLKVLLVPIGSTLYILSKRGRDFRCG